MFNQFPCRFVVANFFVNLSKKLEYELLRTIGLFFLLLGFGGLCCHIHEGGTCMFVSHLFTHKNIQLHEVLYIYGGK
jgi:hypothetical protein